MSLLYAISSPESKLTSFLFGTIHLPKRVIHLDLNYIYEAIHSCDAFGIEVTDEKTVQSIQEKYMFLPPDITLEDLIPPKKWEKYRRIYNKAFKIDLENFIEYRPIIIYFLLLERIVNNGSEPILDMHLMRYAQKMEKKVISLENPEDHFSIMEKIGLDVQLKVLDDLASAPYKVKRDLKKSIDDYNDQDSVKIFKQGKRSLAGSRKIMLYDRNAKMASTIRDIHQSGLSVFATFGAAHLEGKYGIKAYLKKLGFHLKPIKLEHEKI